MERRPVVLIHSGRADEDPIIADEVSGRYPQLTVLTASDEADVIQHLPTAEILFAWQFPIQLLHLATSLRWFQVMGAGIERLAGAQLPPGVLVTNLKGVFGGSMTEYALTYILAHYQGVRRVLDQQQRHVWEQFTPARLAGQTIGIVGLGSIGGAIARACGGLGMRVIGVSRSGDPVDGVECVYPVAQIEQFLPACDVLLTVVPNTRETTGLLTRERLARLKPTCFYINIGRGNVVALEDITHALRSRGIAGAALDVFPEEPLPPDHPLWSFDNVFITPHISGINRPEDVTDTFFANLDRYLAGQPLLNQVNLMRGY
jgi:glyoxylate/hydroxypyruvate reductase A